jgi:hypothetical protein
MKRLFVLFAALALVAAFAITATAAEWNFYGSARMATFYEDKDEDSPSFGSLQAGDDDGTTWDLQGNARIGATVNAGKIGGGFEYGSGPNLRKLYGTYNFGGGEILIGQTYSPTCDLFYSNQVWAADEDLLSIGQFYAGRNPMIQLKVQGFRLALVKPATATVTGLAGDEDVTLPKFEASFHLKQDAFFMDIYGGYNAYEIETPAKTYDVDSFVAGIGAGIDVGSAFIKGNAYFARNHEQYGAYSGVNPANRSAKYDSVKNEIIDNDSFGALGVFGFKASDKLTFEIGYGYAQYELDEDGAEADDAMSYYANVTINIAPGFFIVPEVGVVDFGDDGNNPQNDEGKLTYFGAKWQINF